MAMKGIMDITTVLLICINVIVSKSTRMVCLLSFETNIFSCDLKKLKELIDILLIEAFNSTLLQLSERITLLFL